MDDGKPAVERFEDDLLIVVQRHMTNGTLTAAEIIGTLELTKAQIVRWSLIQDDDDE